MVKLRNTAGISPGTTSCQQAIIFVIFLSLQHTQFSTVVSLPAPYLHVPGLMSENNVSHDKGYEEIIIYY